MEPSAAAQATRFVLELFWMANISAPWKIQQLVVKIGLIDYKFVQVCKFLVSMIILIANID